MLSAKKMKFFFFAILLILASTFVFASDSEFLLVDTGDSELYLINPGDTEFNIIFTNYTDSPIITLTISSGSSSSNAKKIRYDVSVITQKHRYERGETVLANIRLLNTGKVVDEDAILIIYLVSPNGSMIDKSSENILNVPPMHYNWLLCGWFGGRIESDTNYCSKSLTRELSLPAFSEPGIWSFYISYNSPEQEEIIAFDSFEVLEELSYNKNSEIIFDTDEKEITVNDELVDKIEVNENKNISKKDNTIFNLEEYSEKQSISDIILWVLGLAAVGYIAFRLLKWYVIK